VVPESGISFQASQFASASVEAELSVRLKDDLSFTSQYSSEDAKRLIASVIPSIELIDSRYRNPKSKNIYHIISDNGNNKKLLLAQTEFEFSNFDWTQVNAEMIINGNTFMIGSGAKSYQGNLLLAFTWTLRKFVEHKVPLKRFVIL
jgi:2-keto-4-pentenoate hydratase